MYRMPLYMVLMVVASTAQAATEYTDEIPVQLAQTLLRPAFGGVARIYSDMPDEFPGFTLPAGFTVLGSADTITALQVALLPSPDIQDAQASIAQQLELEGWQQMTSIFSRDPNKGFVNTNSPALPVSLCSNDHDGFITIVTVGTTEGPVLLVSKQTRGFTGRSPTCDEQIALNREAGLGRPDRYGLQEHMPRLVIPENAVRSPMPQRIVDEMAGSPRAWETGQALQIDMTLAELQMHFAPQLEEQGWEREQGGTGSFLINSTWTRRVDDNRQLRGILNLLSHGDRDREMSFTIMAPPD